jgi:hypothetical protein
MGYDSLFRTNNYHIVNGKDTLKGEYNIIPNTLDYQNKLFKIERHPEKFSTQRNRPPIASPRFPPNEKRFDNFDRSPSIHSKTIRHSNYSFDHYMPRVVEDTILKGPDFDIEYENVEVQKDMLR